MSVTQLRPIVQYAPDVEPAGELRPSVETLGVVLLRDGILRPHDMVQALSLHAKRRGRLVDILLARGLLDETTLYEKMARHWGVGLADLAQSPADGRLLDEVDPVWCLQSGFLPWRKLGPTCVIACAYPDDFPQLRAALEPIYGPVMMVLAPLRMIEAGVLAARGARLAHRAETRVPAAESCRSFNARALRLPAAILVLGLAVAATIWPTAILLAFTLVALLAMLSFTGLKMAAFLAMRKPIGAVAPPAPIADLPLVSAMVALYRESDIAARLVQRLGRLDYPRELLDVLLVVEEDDMLTRDALARTPLPAWMRVIAVPAGVVKTKPRALNYALDHCRGSIIGVYDAEDAPAPDQIRKVVERFAVCDPKVVCLQGMLDFYNARNNWLARCFTTEYAVWFRLFLPGIERLGLAVPLGGTTLFFRRHALEDLGGWDAHNVTEDADLGLRIARHGLRTELIDTVTLEEANCRALPWVKQRSRWIKGFVITWATHMRNPVVLWRQLGARQFVGFQVLFVGSVLQALLAPVLWSFWLVPLGVHHPVAAALSPAMFTTLWLTFLATEVVSIAFGIAGLSRTQHQLSPFLVPTLIFYHPLASLAAYKGTWELLTRPFYWDKTSHGHFSQSGENLKVSR